MPYFGCYWEVRTESLRHWGYRSLLAFVINYFKYCQTRCLSRISQLLHSKIFTFQVIRRQQPSKLQIFKRLITLLRRRKKTKAIGQSPQQRFYPQCSSCSTKQLSYLSAVARGLKTPNPVVTHVTSLRLRHLFLPFPLLVLSAYKFCALGLC